MGAPAPASAKAWGIGTPTAVISPTGAPRRSRTARRAAVGPPSDGWTSSAVRFDNYENAWGERRELDRFGQIGRQSVGLGGLDGGDGSGGLKRRPAGFRLCAACARLRRVRVV
jgi:hypothetical protein